MNRTLPMRHIYDANKNVIPPEGAWVSVKGNSYSPRSCRLPLSLVKEADIRHLDVYWASNEECPWPLDINALKGLSGFSRYSMDTTEGIELLIEHVMVANYIEDDQLTKVSLHTPYHKAVCLWAGELVTFTNEHIEMLLHEGYLEIMEFGGTNPVWDEETRDIIGSLQVDGLTLNQAQAELIRAGAMKLGDLVVPHYFYRASGEYKNIFYEDWS